MKTFQNQNHLHFIDFGHVEANVLDEIVIGQKLPQVVNAVLELVGQNALLWLLFSRLN